MYNGLDKITFVMTWGWVWFVFCSCGIVPLYQGCCTNWLRDSELKGSCILHVLR